MAKSLKVVNKTVKDPDLVDMFNKMVGASDPDPGIVIPKFERIYGKTKEVIGILGKFHSRCIGIFGSHHATGFAQIKEFTDGAAAILVDLELERNDKIYSGADLRAINSDPAKLTEFLANMDSVYKTDQICPKFKKLKECQPVKEMIMIARNMKSALLIEKDRKRSDKIDLDDKECLSDGFILNSDGDFLRFFNFTSLDFKQIFISNYMTAEVRKYVLQVLLYIYNRVIQIVKDITSPDIDIEKFSEILIKSIDDMRQHIPRCDKAFTRISKSVDLLRGNFDGYYRSFIMAQNCNPSIIIESFVLDVASSNKTDPETLRQFKTIINFYKSRMNNRNVDNPQIKKMMSLMQENLDILDSKMSKRGSKNEEEPKPATGTNTGADDNADAGTNTTDTNTGADTNSEKDE